MMRFDQVGSSPHQLLTATWKTVHIDCIMLIFLGIGDLRERTRFGVVDNIAVDIPFGMYLIDQCIWGIVLTGCEVVP